MISRVIRHSVIVMIALAFYVALVSYRLDYSIVYVLPAGILSDVLSYFTAIMISCVAADYIFRRWNTRLRSRILAAAAVWGVSELLFWAVFFAIRSSLAA